MGPLCENRIYFVQMLSPGTSISNDKTTFYPHFVACFISFLFTEQTLSERSRFWTGNERPPAAQPLSISFLEGGKYPQAATCVLELQLTESASQEEFDDNLSEAIKYSDHFVRL